MELIQLQEDGLEEAAGDRDSQQNEDVIIVVDGSDWRSILYVFMHCIVRKTEMLSTKTIT